LHYCDNLAVSFEAIVAYDKTIIGSVGSTAEDFEQAWEESKKPDVLKVIIDVGLELEES